MAMPMIGMRRQAYPRDQNRVGLGNSSLEWCQKSPREPKDDQQGFVLGKHLKRVQAQTLLRKSCAECASLNILGVELGWSMQSFLNL